MSLFCEPSVLSTFEAPSIRNDTIIREGSFDMRSPLLMYVVVSGEPVFDYKWQKNNIAIPGINGDSLYFDSLNLLDSGMYSCIVTNSFGRDTTLPFQLNVNYVDFNKPVITLLSPIDSTRFGESSFVLTFKVIDESPLKQVTVNDISATSTDSLFVNNISIPNDTNKITIIAIDNNNNKDSINMVIYHNATYNDHASPSIRRVSLLDSAIIEDSILILDFIIKDESNIDSTTINNITINSPDSIYVDTVTLTFGINNITTTAVDNSYHKNTGVLYSTIFYSPNSIPKWVADTLVDTIQENQPYALDLTRICSDSDTDYIHFSMVKDSLAGDTLISNTYTITPTFMDAGTHCILYQAHDGKDTSSVVFLLSIIDVNQKPVFETNSPSKSYYIDSLTTLSIPFIAIDNDNDTISYHISKNNLPRPETVVLDTNLNIINWQSQLNDSGVFAISIIASDGKSSDTISTNIGIGNVNLSPTILISGYNTVAKITTKELTTFQCTLTITDLNSTDKPTMILPVLNIPQTATLDTITQNDTLKAFFSYTPDSSVSNKITNTTLPNIIFQAVDNDTQNISTTIITITVADSNTVPICQNISTTIEESTPTPFNILATDKDQESLAWEVITKPTNGIISKYTGIIDTGYEFIYTANNLSIPKTDQIVIKITDSVNTITTTYTFAITADNDAPIADSIPTLKITDSTDFAFFNISGTDPEGKPCSWEIVTHPEHGKIIMRQPDTGVGFEGVYKTNKTFLTNDSFSVRLFDGVKYSNIVVILITKP